MEDDSCPICCEELNTTNIATTPCGHKFHTTCLLENVKYGSFKCPCCREQLVELIAAVPQRTLGSNENLRQCMDTLALCLNELLSNDAIRAAAVENNVPVGEMMDIVVTSSLTRLQQQLTPFAWLSITHLLQSDETLYPVFRNYFVND